MQTIGAARRTLAEGKTSSRALVEAALAKAQDKAGEGARAFTRLYREGALAAAEAWDRLAKAGGTPPPLAGLPVSIKDLFDVAGETTLAGSVALKGAPPAAADATIVRRLRAAGAVIVGKTNMTEFAFSGVGINPHYGTPGNPYDRSLIPGGSSAGAPVSVADGAAVVAIGTDTGGSVRVPAALCGVVGFKPTQFRVSRDGAIPLSTTLDSIGPLANSVACCAIADAVMAGEPAEAPEAVPAGLLRLAVPRTFFFEKAAPEVASAFADACAALERAGARIVDLPLTELNDYPGMMSKGGFSAIEAFAWHKEIIGRRGNEYDRRVRERIERFHDMSAVEYIEHGNARAGLIARVDRQTAPFDAFLAPTVAITAPPIAAFERDEDYWRLNSLILRNTAIINFLDRCALSLPIQKPGEAPVGLMIVGAHGTDRHLLAVGRGIEQALAA